MVSAWHNTDKEATSVAAAGTCFMEMILHRPGQEHEDSAASFYGRYEELAATAVRALMPVPDLTKALGLDVVEEDYGDADTQRVLAAVSALVPVASEDLRASAGDDV